MSPNRMAPAPSYNASAPPAAYFTTQCDDELPPYHEATCDSSTDYLPHCPSTLSYTDEKHERTETVSSGVRSRQLSTVPSVPQPFSRSRTSSAATSTASQQTLPGSRLYPSVALTPELSPITAFIKEEWEPALDLTRKGGLSGLMNRARSVSVEKNWRFARIEVVNGTISCSESKQTAASIWGGMEQEAKPEALMASFRLRHATIEPPRHVHGRDHCLQIHLMNGRTAIISFTDAESARIWKDGLSVEISYASTNASSKASRDRSLAAKAPHSRCTSIKSALQ
ncbi:hypothetical protein SmJEL517_g01720 [Synchytrium microbalum]|uniref:PH domain-containing protein n=1 Tax=Synchytrium microbalum TaxID=1806994 RepID=A0A507CEF3_9FUNG|nr:uncharacterized protein SmJEL517_g01720 [Synchytrium microbalum]TPX35955.1 hypothetical protein SmJEL517_g01720 [Synchytrium microbalum]